jgi:hypothetical protein
VGEPLDPARPGRPSERSEPSWPTAAWGVGTDPEARRHRRRVQRFADYIYGTISTLVAIAGLTWEPHPEALTTAGVVVVGAVAIWLAHALSRLVTLDRWHTMSLRRSDVTAQLRGSWPIVSAALPATAIFVMAGLHLWTVSTAFALAEVVGVLALAVVAFGTTSGTDRRPVRRIVHIAGLVAVGVTIVLLELLVHQL